MYKIGDKIQLKDSYVGSLDKYRFSTLTVRVSYMINSISKVMVNEIIEPHILLVKDIEPVSTICKRCMELDCGGCV